MTTGNGRGGMRSHSNSRSPPFIVIGLFVVIAILAFNYWSVSSKNSVLARDIADLGERYRLASVKKLAVEKRNDVLMKQVNEKDTESKRIQVSLTKKQDELNNVQAQHSAVMDESQTCKSELDKCSSEQYQSQQTIKNLELSVETAQSDLDAKVKEAVECKMELETIRQSVPNCSSELDVMRIKLLEIVRNLWGSSAVTVLGKSGMDITGVSLDAAQNPPTYQKWPPQQQPGMQSQQVAIGGGQFQNPVQALGQTQGQGQGSVDSVVKGVGEGQGQNPGVAVPQDGQRQFIPPVNPVPATDAGQQSAGTPQGEPGVKLQVNAGSGPVQAPLGDKIQPGQEPAQVPIGDKALPPQAVEQDPNRTQAPEPHQMPVETSANRTNDVEKPVMQLPQETGEHGVGPAPPLGPEGVKSGGEPGLGGEAPIEQPQNMETKGQDQLNGTNTGDVKPHGVRDRSKRATNSPAMAATGDLTDTAPGDASRTGDRGANEVDTYDGDNARRAAQDTVHYQPDNTAREQDTDREPETYQGEGQQNVALPPGPQSMGDNPQIRAPEGIAQTNEHPDEQVGGAAQELKDPSMYREQSGPGVEDDTDYKNRVGEQDEGDEENLKPLGQELQYKKEQYDTENRLDRVQDVGGNDDGIDQMHQNMADEGMLQDDIRPGEDVDDKTDY